MDEALNSKDIRMLSFDFFDTLASRKALTYEVYYCNLSSFLKDSGYLVADLEDFIFRDLRILAEEKVRKISFDQNGHSEISINNIYEQLVKSTNLINKITPGNLANIEATHDCANLIPDIDLINYINAIPEKTIVCIVSDTFYTSDTLSIFCKEIGITRSISIFASSEHGTGKYAGMFKKIIKFAETNQIELQNILHIGDNYNSDVVVPMKYGLNTLHVPFGDSTFWNENNLVSKYADAFFSYDGQIDRVTLRSLVARSVSRIDRYEYDRFDYFEYGVRCIGPIIGGFSSWLHVKAKNNQEDVLLFMLREGEILYQSYNKLRSHLNDQLPSGVIHVSRRALKATSLLNITEDILASFFTSIKSQTIYQYLSLLGLDENDIINIDWKCNIPLTNSADEHKENIIQSILGSRRLLAKLKSIGERATNGFFAHIDSVLEEIGVGQSHSQRVALVDVGWNASIQKQIEWLFSHKKPGTLVSGYYLSTTRYAHAEFSNQKIGARAYGFLFNSGFPELPHDLFMRSPEIIEQVLTSPNTGSLCGYEADGTPVLSSQLLPELQRSQVIEVQNGMIELITQLSNYAKTLDEECQSTTTINWIRSHLLRIVCSPMDEEIAMFSYWIHDENYSSQSCNLIINPTYKKWASMAGPKHIRTLSMFEAYWLYALFDHEVRADPYRIRHLCDRSLLQGSLNNATTATSLIRCINNGTEITTESSILPGQKNSFCSVLTADIDNDISEIHIIHKFAPLGHIWLADEMLFITNDCTINLRSIYLNEKSIKFCGFIFEIEGYIPNSNGYWLKSNNCIKLIRSNEQPIKSTIKIYSILGIANSNIDKL